MSFVTAAIGLGSAVGGKLIDGALAGGGGSAGAPPPPVSNSANFGAVSFGNKFIGDSAVKESATIESIAAGGVGRWLPWAIGGVVVLVLGLIIALKRRGKGRK